MQDMIQHSSVLFGFGLLGVIVMAFIKMNDINQRNETYTFRFVFNKFIQREWPSYGLAITVIIIAALTHGEWLAIFTQKVKERYNIGLGVDLFMVLFGCVGQYFIYKKLGKMAKQPAPDELPKTDIPDLSKTAAENKNIKP